MSSSRLPGKVMKQINGRSMIEWQISRIQKSNADKIIVATSSDDSDDELVNVIRDLGVEVFRGSLTDVNSRFLRILEIEKPDYFIRLTGDCPLVMPKLIDEMISEFELCNLDYLSNVNPPTYPDGLDVEIVSTNSFLEFSRMGLTEEEKEHVTLGMCQRLSASRIANFTCNQDYSTMRWTVDYEEDFDFIRNVFAYFAGKESEFTMDDILKAINLRKISVNVVSHDFRNISVNKGINRA